MTNRYGYCCINLTLQKSRGIMTNRTMRRKTFDAKGLGYVSELSLKNTADLKEIIQWNSENGFEVFRITSTMFPWASEYDWSDLPDIDVIRENLRQAGQLARDTGQRLSFHPGPFNCLASPKEDVVLNCVKDLSIHGDQMDMLSLNVQFHAFTAVLPQENLQTVVHFQPHGALENAIAVLRRPHDVVLAVPNRV